jgi:hypothetical protein
MPLARVGANATPPTIVIVETVELNAPQTPLRLNITSSPGTPVRVAPVTVAETADVGVDPLAGIVPGVPTTPMLLLVDEGDVSVT